MKAINGKYLLLAACVGFSSTAATANDGTITFEGKIEDATCEISGGDDIDPDQGANFTVTLPKVSVSALAKPGQFAGDTPFYINLSGENCPNGKVANVIFERAQSTNIDSATGYLKNTETTGGARNVFVRILNHNKEGLNLTQANAQHQPVTIDSKKASFKYWGQYAAVGNAATAGTVKSDVIYSITYQ
ncbi:fimbrial protein [Erwinia phyllosphaerae]|uniref:fimbrial protein n=1 Tax=Erwinia phyllosphaerae TaxID=2853256 RepID=UPI001FEEFD69|nr:fimbrial protein [Erwinia phyllosphaerae]MBV4368043.1 type 1 fimbrial protein [Erwinia phyllosphaerae]